MHSCKSLIACDNVFFSPILSLKAHSYHATPVALLQSRVLMPFVDSSSIDDKSCLLVLMRIVQYHYLGTAPPVGAAPPLPAQLNQPLDSFVSHHRILLVASSRNPIHPSASYPSQTSTSPRRIHKRGRVRSSNTLRLSRSALFGSRLATRFYDASSLFFGLWSSSLSMLRLSVCLNMCHHFNALTGASSAPRIVLVCFPLVEPPSSTHAFALRIARPIKITCCTSGN
jgi:hypothetical protein